MVGSILLTGFGDKDAPSKEALPLRDVLPYPALLGDCMGQKQRHPTAYECAAHEYTHQR
jgi:hypothetical protein